MCFFRMAKKQVLLLGIGILDYVFSILEGLLYHRDRYARLSSTGVCYSCNQSLPASVYCNEHGAYTAYTVNSVYQTGAVQREHNVTH